MNRGGMSSTGVGALITGRGTDVDREPRSSAQRGSMSGGGASTINVYSHMGQGAMADPYFKDGPGIVAPKNFYGAPDRAPTYSAGSRGGGSRESDSRRSFASAGAQAIGSANPQVSSRRSNSWGGGQSSSVGEALTWGNASSHNQVASSDAFYRRNRGEGQTNMEESLSSAWLQKTGSGNGKWEEPPLQNPNTYNNMTSDAPDSDLSLGGYYKEHDSDMTAPVGSRASPAVMSHGGQTSSSAYGSRYPSSNSPMRPSRISEGKGFNGFGSGFGASSGDVGGKGGKGPRGNARGSVGVGVGGGTGRLPLGYAPATGGGVQAALSSNLFASGASQNCGNVLTDRPSSRVTAPPGGHSTFAIG